MRAYRDTHLKLQNILDLGTPLIAGVCVWFFTQSIWFCLLSVLVGFGIGFSISAQLSERYGCGPDWEELRKAVTNFDKYSVNDDRFYMFLADRNFNLYREDFPDGHYAIGVELPWSDWDDLLKSTPLRKRLQSLAGSMEDGNAGLFAEANDGVDAVLQMITCLTEITDNTMENLEFKLTFRSGAGFDGLFGRVANLKESVGIKK